MRLADFMPLIMLPVMWNPACGLDCFECFSFNKSDPSCGDPFHPAYGRYTANCLQGREGRVGGFPSKYCIKLIGNTAKDDIEMVYRGCSLTTLNNLCGEFRFENVRYHGCIMSCAENGCNGSSDLSVKLTSLSSVALTLFMMLSKLWTLFCIEAL
ncbi:uncharacterized protein LOC128217679 isoform X1 [Mya arenaria]|uniref:uncharacterized protein LOC128217679 isoform X1 n=1 Tax=Mya arenaria TaxID=6604 RepID=UPI0022E4A1CB|nr:uncharacterized protein LOC128217679 isoform X1 [Mya arenaria]